MPWRCVGEVKVQLHIFLTSALDGGEQSSSFQSHFNPKESTPSIHCIGGWVNPIAGLDAVVKKKKSLPLLSTEPQSSIL
jgi:hypothetical protein